MRLILIARLAAVNTMTTAVGEAIPEGLQSRIIQLWPLLPEIRQEIRVHALGIRIGRGDSHAQFWPFAATLSTEESDLHLPGGSVLSVIEAPDLAACHEFLLDMLSHML